MKRFFTLSLITLLAVLLLASCSKPLALDRTELNLTVGDTAVLSAGEATRVNWTSSDSAVAAVNGGTVSAKAAGTAVITASLENGEQANCTVTVSDKLIKMVTLDVKSARIEVGKTIQLSASYAPACKSENDIEASCTVTVGAAQLPTTVATFPPATQAPTQPATSSDEKSKGKQEGETTASPVTSDGGFIFPDSSARYLSDSEVASRLSSMSGSPVSDSFAQDAVNEIFARHGYVFRTPSIRAYYEAQSWYSADPSYDGSLNAAEQYNIALLSGY